jgi:regulator of chromosome condensation
MSGPRIRKAAPADEAKKIDNKTPAPKKAETKSKSKAASVEPEKPPKSSPKATAKAPAKTAVKTTKAAPAKTAAKRKAEDEVEEEPRVNGVKRNKVDQNEGKGMDDAPDMTESGAADPKQKASAAPKAAPAKTKAAPTKKAPAATRTTAAATEINQAPTEKLNVYVFGEGSSGELGLGSAKGQTEVKRPRLNPNLGEDVGVVALSVGGMHTAALTHDSKILTWGVNDQGALGRDTAWDGGLRDMDDADDSDDDSDSGSMTAVNPKESTPAEVDMSALPAGIVFTQVVCTDSATFALTTTGEVYGWGTFRSNEGIFGFEPDNLIQNRPKLISGLKKITQLAAGANHVLALTSSGTVYCWGSGQQNQLGRRILERHAAKGLIPGAIGTVKKVVTIGAGAYNSFAVKENGDVYSWGLNNFGQTGIPKDFDEEGNSKGNDVHMPINIKTLKGKGKVICIQGGSHHTVAVTDKHELLVWGRVDGSQAGLNIDDLPEGDIVRDSGGHPRILVVPTQIPGIKATCAAAGSDHCIAIDKDGKAWSWGFSTTYQTGQGTDEDIDTATMIDNTAVRDKKLLWAGAGSQFSVIAGVNMPTVNGVNGHA